MRGLARRGLTATALGVDWVRLTRHSGRALDDPATEVIWVKIQMLTDAHGCVVRINLFVEPAARKWHGRDYWCVFSWKT